MAKRHKGHKRQQQQQQQRPQYTIEDAVAGVPIPEGTPLTPGGGLVMGVPGYVSCGMCGKKILRSDAGAPIAVIDLGGGAKLEAFKCPACR